MTTPTILSPAPSKPRTKTPNFISPKAMPKQRKRWTKWVRRMLIAFSGLLLLGVILVGAFVAYAWNTMSLPPDTPLSQTTFLMDANGNRLASFNAGENRVPVNINDVPVAVRNAIIDTEDHNFYSHKGVDPRGIVRAFWDDFNNKGNYQGGSTITQQYVKLTYVGKQRTFSRKFKEAVLAVKLERKYSKDEILGRYLNTIYFGRSSYGIQTASRAYFGKDVQQLTAQEGAYLAGLIRAPELADTDTYPAVADERRNISIDDMVKYGQLPAADAAAIKAKPVGTYTIKKAAVDPAVVMADKGTQYFVQYVKQVLTQKYGEQMVEGGGLRVTTTLDPTLQAKAYDSINGFLKPSEPSGALVSLDNNGEIKAMVGGRDYNTSQVNLAVGKSGGGSGRQAGSTFKPFALAAAIDSGVSVNETFEGPPHIQLPIPGSTWNVSNFGNESFGRINLLQATAESVNTVYAQLALKIGPQAIVDMAHKAGITSQLDPNPALVLGTDSVTPLEMADAYLTFAQRGLHVDATPLVEVKNPSGETLEHINPKRTQVMSQKTADTVNLALQGVVQHGTGVAAGVGKPLAGKTGTASDNGDAWFVGYTPTIATAVWMGFPEGAQHAMTNVRGIAVTGGTFPAQMFHNFMTFATKSSPATAFVTPTDLGTPPVTDQTTTTVSTVVPTTAPGLVPVNPVDPGGGKGGVHPSPPTTESPPVTFPHITIPSLVPIRPQQ